jgi:putative ABC transport system substrate-binding protein
MTGIADAGFGISARRLQVFAEMVPSMATVLLPISALNAFQRAEADAYQIIAARLGLTLVTLELDDENPAEVLEGFIRLHDVDGIIAPRDVDLNIPGTVVQLATRLALPSMFEISPYVQAGGLASYGYSEAAAGRQIARMIEAIIGGAHPRDIPVEPPASIELVINMATAERLGLSIPMVVFSQVDRVVR